MSIDDIESDPEAVETMHGHLRAALDHASDETARFHIRHAIQLEARQAPNHTADGDDRADPGV